MLTQNLNDGKVVKTANREHRNRKTEKAQKHKGFARYLIITLIYLLIITDPTDKKKYRPTMKMHMDIN